MLRGACPASGRIKTSRRPQCAGLFSHQPFCSTRCCSLCFLPLMRTKHCCFLLWPAGVLILAPSPDVSRGGVDGRYIPT